MEIIAKVSQFVIEKKTKKIERERKIRFQEKCQKLAEILFDSAVIMGVSWGRDYARWAEGPTPGDSGVKHIRIEGKRGRSNTSLTGPPSLIFPAYSIFVYSYNQEVVEGCVNITINKEPDEIVNLEFYDPYTKYNPYAKWEVTKKPGGFQGRFHDNIFDPEYVQRWIDNIGEWRFLR